MSVLTLLFISDVPATDDDGATAAGGGGVCQPGGEHGGVPPTFIHQAVCRHLPDYRSGLQLL